jgi:catechol 2,3-dioxygenase-like lactoylglutathione lyase family enzyme
MVSIGSVVINVSDISRAAEFYTKALGYVRSERNPAILAPKNGGGPFILLDREDRMHLDLWAADEAEQRSEIERLESLGAKRVEWTYPEGADFVVLADPDGNLFCVVDTSR